MRPLKKIVDESPWCFMCGAAPSPAPQPQAVDIVMPRAADATSGAFAAADTLQDGLSIDLEVPVEAERLPTDDAPRDAAAEHAVHGPAVAERPRVPCQSPGLQVQDSMCEPISPGPTSVRELFKVSDLSLFPEFSGGRWCGRSYDKLSHYTWEIYSAFLGTLLGAGLAAFGTFGTVEVPVGFLIGMAFAILLIFGPSLRRCLCDVLGCPQRHSRKAFKHLTSSTASNELTERTRFYLKPQHLPRECSTFHVLDMHPLLDNLGPHLAAEQPGRSTDWCRLLQNIVVDAISANDIRNASLQQAQLLIAPLLLCPDFNHLRGELAKHLQEDESLAFQAYCIWRSEENTQRSGIMQTKRWLQNVLGRHRFRCFSAYVTFYERLCCMPINPDEVMRTDTGLPEGLIGPLRNRLVGGPSGTVVELSLERRFTSGHGPTLLHLGYSAGNPRNADGQHSESDYSATDSDALTNSIDVLDPSRHVWPGIGPHCLHLWPRRILVKPDTVKNDSLVAAMCRVFNYLWRHSFIPREYKPCALDYEVLPAGPEFGFVEFVENSVPARAFNWRSLEDCNTSQILVFLSTAAGSIVAGHVLGIGDRHEDNSMVRTATIPELGPCFQFFHIDFKHCFGDHTKLDVGPIAISRSMKRVLYRLPASRSGSAFLRSHTMTPPPAAGDTLSPESSGAPSVSISGSTPVSGSATDSSSRSQGTDNGNMWAVFKAMCGIGFRVLRRSNNFIIHLSQILVHDAGLSPGQVEQYLTGSLGLVGSEDEAVQRFCDLVEGSPHNVSKLVKDWAHEQSMERRERHSE